MQSRLSSLLLLVALGCTTPRLLPFDAGRRDASPMDAQTDDAQADDAQMDDSPPDAFVCLPPRSPCSSPEQCCGGLACAMILSPASVVCCGLQLTPCATTDGSDCCGNLDCETTSAGHVCCGWNGEPCNTSDGSDCCGSLGCVDNVCQ